MSRGEFRRCDGRQRRRVFKERWIEASIIAAAHTIKTEARLENENIDITFDLQQECGLALRHSAHRHTDTHAYSGRKSKWNFLFGGMVIFDEIYIVG